MSKADPNSSPKFLGERLRTALASIPSTHLQCRDIRHLWKVTKDLHVTAQATKENLMEVERHLVCTRCKTERADFYQVRTDRWGLTRMENLGSRYSYPKDYLIKEMALVEHPREILLHEQLRRALQA
jgi:hypothetical protein